MDRMANKNKYGKYKRKYNIYSYLTRRQPISLDI